MPSQRFWPVCLVLVPLLAGVSCRKGSMPASPGPAPLAPAVDQPASAPLPDLPNPPPGAGPLESEPTAGRWATILFPSPAAIPVADPPGESAARREFEELRQHSTRRSAEVLRSVAWWDAGGVRRWNEIARGLAASHHLNSSQASRMFALLAVAQYDALVATWHHKYRFKQPAPRASGAFQPASVRHVEQYSYPSQDAAVAAVSASVLSYVLDSEGRFLWRNAEAHRDSRLWAGTAYQSDAKAGYEIGLAVGEIAKEWGEADGARKAHRGPVSKQPGKWWAERQTMPGWGKVKPWLMKSAADLRAPEPPPVGSPKFEAAVREVRAAADSRSAEQLLIAQYWDLGVGAISVPGMWDQLAIDLMNEADFSEPRMARALALANMAMMDAGIACWETKYHYLVPRPTMMDAKISCVMNVPEHPSYSSGHASFSGAASAVIGYVLPDKAGWLADLAEQAAMSRLYGGVHYRFDDDEGLKQGRAAGALAIERGKKDGCPPR